MATEFAIIQTGGKQYKVSKGDVLNVEKLGGKQQAGEKIVFDKVLLVDNGKDTSIGTPFIEGAKVEGEMVAEGRNKKVTVIHYKPKVRYFKKAGHRQPFFKIKITNIK